MPAVCLIRRESDVAFVEDWLLPPLGPLGFDRALAMSTPDDPQMIEQSAAVLVVVTEAAPKSPGFVQAAKTALRSRTPVVPVYRSVPAISSPLVAELDRAAGIDASTSVKPADLWPRLARLLPLPKSAHDKDLADAGVPIEWNAEALSVLLDDSAERNDFEFGAKLVEAFARHTARRGSPYPADRAAVDLEGLRAERQFLLMRRYAAAAVGSGTTDFAVRRQLAQALIELKDFDEATRVLGPLIEETPTGYRENYEARGLLGRAYKQRYVDADGHGDSEWLTTAIAVYWSAFVERNDNVWHGINAVSCLLRADRDGVATPPTDQPEQIAHTILDVLERRRNAADENRLPVWDYATEVEAYVDLGDFAAAARSLEEYIAHPDMEPFEVASTYRQFDEVLQLWRRPEGRPILGRLASCATRLGAGGLTSSDAVKQLLVRVADPAWAPSDVPDLELGPRLGAVVSISGSYRTVEALVKDPLVIAIEESRPAGEAECARSMPFVQAQDTYQWDSGPFSETGAHALIAIIDNGIDVLHRAFLDADGASRIVGIWDQNDPNGPADPTVGADFGSLHTAADIARYVREQKVPNRLARGGEHGTHVASIAAGRACGPAQGGFIGGVAPDARILVVISDGSEPTGYSKGHLAALPFIDKMATSLGLPVVVNVSQGMNAGAHDGKSPFEVAFNTFCRGGWEAGRVVVKSAGNERNRRGHAKLTIPPGAADDLTWRCPPGASRKVRLELWWDSANTYRFQLRSPLGETSAWVDRSNQDVEAYFRRHGGYRIQLAQTNPGNTCAKLQIELACGSSKRDIAQWTLMIEAIFVRREGDLQAWIERNGTEPLTEFANHDTEEMTISVPGTAEEVITVGAVEAVTPVRIGTFSSFGPTKDGRKKPDICAPGVNIRAAHRGSVDGVIAKSGTSMAAPHVAGAVALLLSKAAAEEGTTVPTSSQILTLITQNTKFKNTYWDRGHGFGVLDVKALLENGLPSLL
jgi:subtilisin family serine protease